MPTLAMNAPLPNARKNAPQPKSGGKSAPKSKRGYQKKKMEYWNNRGKKSKKLARPWKTTSLFLKSS